MSSALPSDSAPSVHPEEFFDFLLEKTPDQVYLKDRNGRFLRASRAVAPYLDTKTFDHLNAGKLVKRRPPALFGEPAGAYPGFSTSNNAFADDSMSALSLLNANTNRQNRGH